MQNLASKSSVSKLELIWRKRPGGGARTERDYLDFVVDGQSLSEMVGADLASCIGWTHAANDKKALNRLLLKETADFTNNRRSLYVCPECADPACGAVSVVIEKVGD